MLYIRDFDIEIKLLPDVKNKAIKLRLGAKAIDYLNEKYSKENDIALTNLDSELPFIIETIFTLRDLKKYSRFCAMVRIYLGFERLKHNNL